MGRNDFDRRTDGFNSMQGGMMNQNRGGYMNRGGFVNRGTTPNRGGIQNRGGGMPNRNVQRGGQQQRGSPSVRGVQPNRGGQQRPRGGSQTTNTITVTPNKNVTNVKPTPQQTNVLKEEKKTPVKSEQATIKTEKTTPQQKTPAQNVKSPQIQQRTTPTQQQNRTTPTQQQNRTTPSPTQQQNRTTPTQQQNRTTPSPQPRTAQSPQQQRSAQSPQQNRSTPSQQRTTTPSPQRNTTPTEQRTSENMLPPPTPPVKTPSQQQGSRAAQNQPAEQQQNTFQSSNKIEERNTQGQQIQTQTSENRSYQQNQGRNSYQGNRNRDNSSNRGDRGFNQNRRDRGDNRQTSYQNKNEDEPKAPREEKKFTMRCRLFMGNLSNDVTEEDFKEMFEPFGELSEVYVNAQRGFGFVRLDYRNNAEAAKAALDGTTRKGRTLRVRFASHGSALRVRNLSPFVSNELLESAFSQLGEVERAIVICDDRGKSTGEGVVEFARKQNALQAIKRINDGAFILTAAPRPIFVEPLEQKDEEDGLAEKFIPRNDQYRKERDVEPRFASPGSFEFNFASKWKQIVEMEKNQMEQVKRNVEEAKLKLEGEMENAQIEHQEELIRKDLMRQQEELRRLQEIRQQSELRRRQELEMRMRQQEEDDRLRQDQQQRRQDNMIRRNDNMHYDALGQEDMMIGPGGRGSAPPLPPPPAPPASMGLDRGRQQMGNNYPNPLIGGDSNLSGPGSQLDGYRTYDNGLPYDQGNQGNSFNTGGSGFQGQGNMSGMGGVAGPVNVFNQSGLNTNGQGMRGGDRGMDRRREGGPREDYGEMKRMRRY